MPESKIVDRTIWMTFLTKRHARRLYAIAKQFEYYWWFEWKRRDMMAAHASAPNIGPMFFAVDEPYRPRQMAEMPPEMDEALMQKLTAEDQDPDLVQEVYDKIRQLLTSYERVEAIFFQHKTAVIPATIIVTNWRFFIYRPLPTGNAEIHDYWLALITKNKIVEEVLFSVYTAHLREFKETDNGRIESFISTSSKPAIHLGFLPKDQALKLVTMMKELEVWWLDEWRRYELQYNRAISGTTAFFDYGMPDAPHTTEHSEEKIMEDRATRIAKLQSMWSQGLLTAEEYHAINKAIMENKPVELDPSGVRIDDSSLGTSSLKNFGKHDLKRGIWDNY